ncbi:MAG: trehalase-like domain-containing protein, partial [Afipia sp.]|nr:trehalase-like domain-containing protein [Afipia sp.]
MAEALSAAEVNRKDALHRSNLELWPIGNCQVSGLIDRYGALVWGCVPRVDGDPVFCALLNGDSREAGVWRFELEGQVSASQAYEHNTATLVTRLEASDGSVAEIRDFCPRFERSGRMYRPVAFIRIVRPVAGTPRIRIVLRPMTDYGARIAETTSGTNHIRFLIGPQSMR